MASDRYAYWGILNHGSAHCDNVFWLNRKATTRIRNNFIELYIPSNIDEYSKTTIYTNQSTGELTQTTDTFQYLSGRRYSHMIGMDLWRYQPSINFYSETTERRSNNEFHNGKVSPIIAGKFWEIHEELGIEEIIDKVFDTSLIVNPFNLLGYKLLPPHKQTYNTIREFTPDYNVNYAQRLKSITNIIPYKSNLIDYFTTTLNLLYFSNPKEDAGSYYSECSSGLEYAWNTNKETVFAALDNEVATARCVEIILKNKGISYEYFCLDEDDYRTTFNLEETITENFSNPQFDKDDSRYKFLEMICKEYISSRDITDLRLGGKSNDGII